MSQRYVNPLDIAVEPQLLPAYAGKRLRAIVDRDGQIEPLLVRSEVVGDTVELWVTDRRQAERLDAYKLAGFETVITEDEWTADDL